MIIIIILIIITIIIIIKNKGNTATGNEGMNLGTSEDQ